VTQNKNITNKESLFSESLKIKIKIDTNRAYLVLKVWRMWIGFKWWSNIDVPKT